MNDSSVSAARRASSWVGEFGDEAAALPAAVDRPVRLLLLLLWRSCGDETAWSIPNVG
jgi:hypothetical protein